MMATRTIEDLTIDDVHELFDSVIFLRGEEYYDEGCVLLIEPLDPQRIKGIVQGTQKYDVSISIDAEGEITCECSCPCDFNCKHAAAALLKWLSIKKRYKNKLQQGKSSSKESLVQLLEKKSKEELIELLKTVIEKHPEFTSLVKIERKEVVSAIKRLFSQYWDWDEVQDLIDQLEAILEGIRRNKQAWNKALLDEMSMCSKMMIKNVENIHDEGDLSIFLDDWFEIYGELFSTTKPTINEKKEFIRTIVKWIEKDDYGYDSSYEKALVGMSKTEEDITLIKTCLEATESRYPGDKEYYQEFYLELYDKIGMDEKYIEIAEQSGLTSVLIDKLIALNRLDEALKICNENIQEDFSMHLEIKKIEILKKLGKKPELAQGLFNFLEKTGEFNYYLKLKQESPKEEWKNYLERIITDAKNKRRFDLLSRIYYTEKDFKNAYEYTQDIHDLDYLELLAKKLTTANPELACKLFKRLCFDWITQDAGWPYKKSGKMLEVIKRIDKQGMFFKQTKEEIIREHKKKYSLMEVIERI
jgi:uncharacterized Zn finger protein